MLSVLHLCRRFYPQRGGGETYIGALIQELNAAGIETNVLAAGSPEADYVWNGVPVSRADDEELIASTGRSRFLDRFVELLERKKPDVVHWHYLPNEASQLLDACARLGVRNVQTFLHPVTVCMRHDLLRFGETVCDVRPNAQNCGPCMAHFKGVPRVLAEAFTFATNVVPASIKTRLPHSRMKTSLNLADDVGRWVELQQCSLKRFDRHITISAASVQMLELSGVDAGRIRVSRLGTRHSPPNVSEWKDWRTEHRPLRIIFVGRLDIAKGVATLARAVSSFSSDEIVLDIYGSTGDAESEVRLLANIDRSPVRFLGPLPDDDVVQRMSEYDFVAIPSQFFETGPFTAVEALQSGTPILANDIPSLNEFVDHGKNGWLVSHRTVSAWRNALRVLYDQPDAARNMRAEVKFERSMHDVMIEVLDTYRRVCESQRDASISRLQY